MTGPEDPPRKDFGVSRLALRPAAPDGALCLGVPATQVFLDTYATRGIRAAIAREATVLWLTSRVHNRRALAFYRGRGYRDHGATVFTFEGEDHDNRLLARRLGP